MNIENKSTKPQKFIFIMSDPPAYQEYGNRPRPLWNWDTKAGSWVGIWGYDWDDQISAKILEYVPGVVCEVWQPDVRADKIYSATLTHGLTHVLFPAKLIYEREGFKKNKTFYCAEMVERIREYISNDDEFVVVTNLQTSRLNRELLALRIPLVFEYLGLLDSLFELNFSWNILKLLHRYLGRMGKISLIKKVPHVLVGQFPNASELVGKYSESNVTSFLIGIDSEVWRIIPKNEARAKLSISTNEFVVLSTSRLVPLKQIDKLIIALSRIKNVNFKLFISGHGTREYEKYLHDLVRQYSMQDKVVFIGYVSEEELVTYYCASDLFVNVSLRDGGPMTAWKALALEVPVFNSNSGEVYYFLMKHNSGVIVSPKNYAEWERKLHAIISGSLRINRISRDTVLAELNWESNMKKIASAFQEIIEKYKAKKKR